MKKSIMFLILVALGLTVQNTFAMGPGHGAPDGGSTLLMLAAGLGGLAWCRNRLRR